MDETGAPERDVEWERQWSADACRSAGVSCDHLTAFAEDRAGTDPVRDLESRDFRQEILEELADARNYLVWAAKQLGLRDGSAASDERMILFGCLSIISAAFEMARRLQHA